MRIVHIAMRIIDIVMFKYTPLPYICKHLQLLVLLFNVQVHARSLQMLSPEASSIVVFRKCSTWPFLPWMC